MTDRPTDWKIVPVEPTEAMDRAGFSVNRFENKRGCPGVAGRPPPPNPETEPEAFKAWASNDIGFCRIGRVTIPAAPAYEAMLSTSPDPLQDEALAEGLARAMMKRLADRKKTAAVMTIMPEDAKEVARAAIAFLNGGGDG